MIIEFIGLPGAGKTYLCDKLIGDLRSKGIKASNFIEDSRSKFMYKAVFKALGASEHIPDSRTSVLASKLKELLAPYMGIKAKYNDCCIDSYITDLCRVVAIEKIVKKRSSVCLIDEGLFQRAVTMIINYDIDELHYRRLLSILSRYASDTVYLRISPEQAFESVRKRNRCVCAMDRLGDDDLKVFLNRYYELCEFISERSKLTVVHRDDPENINILNSRFNFGGV
ncbi:MAG: hypothetical protein IKO47_06000 [Ruminococcus sp.]|nr:hypothetical protein [Ruminococcus sp.]